MSRDSGRVLPGDDRSMELLVAKVDSLQLMLGQLVDRRLTSLELKLDGLRELLARRRKDHYVVEEIAELTGRSCYTIRRWISEGRLSAIRIPDGGPRGKLLVPRSELERLITSGKGGDIPVAALH